MTKKLGWSLHGQQVSLYLHNGKTTTGEFVKISNTLNLLTNIDQLNGGTPADMPSPYRYIWNLGKISVLTKIEDVTNGYVVGFDLLFGKYKILWKKDQTGNLFRRIYKIENDIIFLGTIQKDPEDCSKPSPIITIQDYEYLKEKGWTEYKEEPSAESRANDEEKIRKNG